MPRLPKARVGPGSPPSRLLAVDARTREGKLVRTVQRDLTQQLGGKPTAAERMLINRCAYLSLRLALLDMRMALGELSEHDHRFCISWSNSLTKTLKALGLKSGKAAAPAKSLTDYLAERRAAP
jgi:hypothetical protein